MTKEEYIARLHKFRAEVIRPMNLGGDDSKWANRMRELQARVDAASLPLVDEEFRRLEITPES